MQKDGAGKKTSEEGLPHGPPKKQRPPHRKKNKNPPGPGRTRVPRRRHLRPTRETGEVPRSARSPRYDIRPGRPRGRGSGASRQEPTHRAAERRKAAHPPGGPAPTLNLPGAHPSQPTRRPPFPTRPSRGPPATYPAPALLLPTRPNAWARTTSPPQRLPGTYPAPFEPMSFIRHFLTKTSEAARRLPARHLQHAARSRAQVATPTRYLPGTRATTKSGGDPARRTGGALSLGNLGEGGFTLSRS